MNSIPAASRARRIAVAVTPCARRVPRWLSNRLMVGRETPEASARCRCSHRRSARAARTSSLVNSTNSTPLSSVAASAQLVKSVGAINRFCCRRRQADARPITIAELNSCRLQSSTQLVDGPGIGRYRSSRAFDPFDRFQRDAGSLREVALFDPKHRTSRSDLFTGQHYAQAQNFACRSSNQSGRSFCFAAVNVKRTPGRPPFMNSIPAASRARRIAVAVTPCARRVPRWLSNRLMVGRETPEALARCRCSHRRRARAARTSSLVSPTPLLSFDAVGIDIVSGP
jgi:hypothetical protein